MKKYRKKPVEVEAVRFDENPWDTFNVWLGQGWGRADAHDVAWEHPDDGEQVVVWNSIEKSWIPCPVGWWVVRGVKGEFYPVAPDVFEATYEPAENGDSTP